MDSIKTLLVISTIKPLFKLYLFISSQLFYWGFNLRRFLHRQTIIHFQVNLEGITKFYMEYFGM